MATDSGMDRRQEPGQAFHKQPWHARFTGGDGNLVRLFVIMVLIFAALSLARPETFPTWRNFQSMAVQFPEIGILAIAIMIAMLTGGIDLSVVGTANLGGILAAMILTRLAGPEAASPLLGIALAVLAALAIGVACGLFNGFLVSTIGITPILATLGTSTLYTGLSVAISKGTAIFAVPQFLWLGNGNVLGIPVPLIVFVVLAAVFSVLLNRTKYGYEVYMLGTNPTAARFSGIDNTRVLMRTYLYSGLLAATAGLIFLARNNSAKADYGASYVLLTVLIAILGGVSATGGFGKIGGLVMAVLSLQFLSSGLSMLLFGISGSNFFREFAWGALLLAVMVLNYYSAKRSQRVRVLPQSPPASSTASST